MFGIDVSEFQGNINWESAKNQVNFAILRMGWIRDNRNHLDGTFERNYNECKRLGIPIGIYVYCYCSSVETVKASANWVVENLKGKSFELPVFLDMEDNSIGKLGKEVLTNICIAFNTIIEKAGFRAGVYANRNWFDNYLKKDVLKASYVTWIAHYGLRSTNAYQGDYDMWQNSSTGKVAGINGNVDTDYLYTDLISNKTQLVGPPKPSNMQIAQEVLDGKWGNGQERADRLTNAGYDYQTIQKIVNDLAKQK